MRNYWYYVASVTGFVLFMLSVIVAIGGVIGGIIFCIVGTIQFGPAAIVIGLLAIVFGLLAGGLAGVIINHPYR